MTKRLDKLAKEMGADVRREHMERIRERYMRKRASSSRPEIPCAKCGATAWFPDDDDMWRCFTCGARGKFDGGKFSQRG